MIYSILKNYLYFLVVINNAHYEKAAKVGHSWQLLKFDVTH